MEVTFTTDLSDKLENIIQHKISGESIEKTPFEELLEKRSAKRRERKRELKEKFLEKLESDKKEIRDLTKKDKKKKSRKPTEEQKKSDAELSLLIMDPSQKPSKTPENLSKETKHRKRSKKSKKK